MQTSAPSLRANVVANYVGRLWSIASVYVFFPIYIRILGIEAFGLVAFYSVILAVLFVADAGLSSAFAREAARCSDQGRLLDLLVTVERLLIGLVGSTGLCMMLGADLIAVRWLRASDVVVQEQAADCIRLMGLAFVPQVMIALYFGGLMGLQRQVRANAFTVSFGLVRSGMVVLPIYFSPDPRVFFAWQAGVSWIFVMVMRSDLRRALGANSGSSGAFSLVRLKPVLGYASGMMAMSVIAGVNTQLDRLVVSRLRPLDEFSYYSLAATLSQIPTVVTMPIAMALLPRFTALNEAAQHATLRQLYELNTYLIATCSSIAAFVLVFFAHDVMSVWMHGQEIPTVVVPVIQLLSMGGLFLALQLTPFQLSLANGHNRTNVRLGAVALVITIPMQVIFTSRYGVVGAAIPWLALNAFAFAYLGVVLNRRFNEGHARDWFVECTMVPVLISGASLCFARIATDWLGYSAARACIVATLFCLVGAAIAFATWPSVRRRLEHA